MNYLENISLKKLITLIKTEIKTNTEDLVFCSEEDTEAATNSINADTLNGYTVDLLLDKIYPIGSIYMSLNSADPATLFGGTWEQIKDTFLLSAGDSYEVGSTGGEAEVTLTVEQMPSHEGHMPVNTNAGWGEAGEDTYYMPTTSVAKYGTSRPYVVRAGNEVVPRAVSKGGSQPHNNMPPYLSVFMWQRTA